MPTGATFGTATTNYDNIKIFGCLNYRNAFYNSFQRYKYRNKYL